MVAASGVIAERSVMRDIARAGIAGAATERRVVAEVGAFRLGALSAGRVPVVVATEWVVGADVVAAGLVAAAGGSVGEAAIACIGIPAFGAGTCIHRSRAILIIQRHAGTDQIPFVVAAEGVVAADGVAAILVIALGCPIRGAARSRTGVTAIPIGATATSSALSSQFDADGIPRRVTTRRVGCTDVIAASLVVAARGEVDRAAIASWEVAAISRVARSNGLRRADSVPDDFAADGVVGADRLATLRLGTAGREVGIEAGSGRLDPASASTTI